MFINKDPTIPKAIGENLLISAGKKGVRFMPIKDKPKSAIANTIRIIPKIFIKYFLIKRNISKQNKNRFFMGLVKFKRKFLP